MPSPKAMLVTAVIALVAVAIVYRVDSLRKIVTNSTV